MQLMALRCLANIVYRFCEEIFGKNKIPNSNRLLCKLPNDVVGSFFRAVHFAALSAFACVWCLAYLFGDQTAFSLQQHVTHCYRMS